jgi:UDP-glucose 4-epimerase
VTTNATLRDPNWAAIDLAAENHTRAIHGWVASLQRSRVAVTGGCGFIGAATCSLLVDADNDVLIIDDGSRGSPENLPARGRERVRLVAADVRDATKVERAFIDFQPSVVVHLAANHFIPMCDVDPAGCISVNVAGTQTVLDVCAGADSIETVVLASTGAVYQPSEVAHSEHSPLGPTDIYGYSKLWGEQLCALFHRRTAKNVGIARLFNVFGPGETNPHLIPEILEQMLRGNEVCLGNVATKRDYVYVDDVADALARLAYAAPNHGVLTVNIGAEREYDALDVVRFAESVTGKKLVVRIDPARTRESDRPHLLSNCNLARSALGWCGRTDLRTGLKQAGRRPRALSAVAA